MTQNKPMGCKRITVDIPVDLYQELYARAVEPPSVPVAEYVRRILAHFLDHPIPSRTERTKHRLRLDGAIAHPGRKVVTQE